MKRFKIIDFWVSVVLIICFTIASFIRMDLTFIYGYFIVGAWQIISMITHISARCFIYRGSSRYTYNWIVLIALVTLPLGSYIILFFAAPLMAIFYTCICYRETYIKMQRPLALLK